VAPSVFELAASALLSKQRHVAASLAVQRGIRVAAPENFGLRAVPDMHFEPSVSNLEPPTSNLEPET